MTNDVATMLYIAGAGLTILGFTWLVTRRERGRSQCGRGRSHREHEAAKRLAKLGGSQPGIKGAPRRRQDVE